jgi:hypothetical protein
VFSLDASFRAHETVLHCPRCTRVFDSQALQRWVPHGCNTAWNILVFVGRRLFEHHHSVQQVCAQLLARGVALSYAQVNKLGHKFIAYLALGHRRVVPRIKQAMVSAGGYILHIDATHEADAPALMTGMDGLSRLVLASVKVPSENAEHIIPFLKQLRRDYGEPIACVHDMGTGLCKAVSKVFPNALDFICHFHFLRDVGKDLLNPAYSQLRSYLRQHAATTRFSAMVRQAKHRLSTQAMEAAQLAKAIEHGQDAQNSHLLSLVSVYVLAQWCLDGKHTGNGYRFPFDRALLVFAQRILTVVHSLPQLLKLLPGDDKFGNRAFFKLARKIIDIAQDPLFEQIVQELCWRSQLFDQLRLIMRIAVPGDKNGLNDEGSPEAMDSIRKGVEAFRLQILEDSRFSADPLCFKMVEQIDKYGDKLFADPITVSTPSGDLIIYPQRTNNLMEQFFRSFRRGYRKKTGNNSMNRFLRTMLADTPLVKNLSNPGYMEILLDQNSCLEELFADLEPEFRALASDSSNDVDRILPGFRSLIKMPALPDLIIQTAMRAQATA